MAFQSLKVHCSLWSWREAGLRHWLLDTPEAAEAVRKPPRPVAQARTHSAPRPEPAVRPEPAAPHPHENSPRPPERPAYVQSSRTPETPPQQASPRSASLAAPRPDIVPPHRWPAAWGELFARCPKRPTVVWTYPAMSEDYGGRSDPTRRAFLQRLLKDMAMPPGSNAFWPMTPPPYDVQVAEATLEADPVFFHSGIAALNPAVVLFFGPAPQSLNLPPIPMLSSLMVNGRMMGQVHPINILAEPFKIDSSLEVRTEGRRRHETLVQFLKSMFGAISI